jgi:hypothetical protein
MFPRYLNSTPTYVVSRRVTLIHACSSTVKGDNSPVNLKATGVVQMPKSDNWRASRGGPGVRGVAGTADNGRYPGRRPAGVAAQWMRPSTVTMTSVPDAV